MMKILDLPNEILAKIFQHLDWSSRKSAMAVCDRWSEVILSSTLLGEVRVTLSPLGRKNGNEYNDFIDILSRVNCVRILLIFGKTHIFKIGCYNIFASDCLSKFYQNMNSLQPAFSWSDYETAGQKEFSELLLSDKEKELSLVFKNQLNLHCLLIDEILFNYLHLPSSLKHLQISLKLNGNMYVLRQIANDCQNLEFINIYLMEHYLYNHHIGDLVKRGGPKDLKVLFMTYLGPCFSFPSFEVYQNLKCLGLELFKDENLSIVELFQCISQLKNLKALFLKILPWDFEKFMEVMQYPNIMLHQVTHLSLNCRCLEILEMISIIEVVAIKFPILRSVTMNDCNLKDVENLIGLFISSFRSLPNLKRFGIGKLYGTGRQNLLMFLEKLLVLSQEKKFESVCLCLFKNLKSFDNVCVKKSDKPRIVNFIKTNFICTFCEPKFIWRFSCDCCKIPNQSSVTPFLSI